MFQRIRNWLFNKRPQSAPDKEDHALTEGAVDVGYLGVSATRSIIDIIIPHDLRRARPYTHNNASPSKLTDLTLITCSQKIMINRHRNKWLTLFHN